MPALPNLIVIGAMKCGTTSLHEYLDRHPEIGMSNPKEVDFFTSDITPERLDWYRRLFDETKAIRGESSQNYSKAHHPLYADAARRLHQLIPNCKLIYLVRDPVARYLSHIAENLIGETEDVIRWNIENDHYVKTGLYHYQLQHFLQFFPLSSILVVDLHELQQQRLATLNAIFDFLEVERLDDASVFDFVANANGEDVVTVQLRKNAIYRAANKLAPTVTDTVVRTPFVRNLLLADSKPKELTPEERAALRSRFQPNVDQLRKLVGKDFASWSV